MTDKQKRTIYDIAERVGASPSTVSAALNGSWKKRRIKKETAERIIQAARDFGYSANLQARGLRTSNSGLVALLIPDYNRFFSNIAQTFSREVRARVLLLHAVPVPQLRLLGLRQVPEDLAPGPLGGRAAVSGMHHVAHAGGVAAECIAQRAVCLS